MLFEAIVKGVVSAVSFSVHLSFLYRKGYCFFVCFVLGFVILCVCVCVCVFVCVNFVSCFFAESVYQL